MGPDVARRAMRDMYRTAIDPNAPPELRQIAHEELNAMVRDAARPPEELERERREQAYEERERRLTEREKRLAEQDDARKAEHWRGVLERDLSSALRSTGIEPNGRTVGMIARHFETLANYGLPMDETTYREAARMVAKELTEQREPIRSEIRALRGEALAKELGDEALQSLRELELAKLTGGIAPSSPPTRTPDGRFEAVAPPRGGQKQKYLSEDEMLDAVAKKRWG
jgi:hypothetical protein